MPATLKRDLEYLRSRLGAPIEYGREHNHCGFAATADAAGGTNCQACGFGESELHSLLMARCAT